MLVPAPCSSTAWPLRAAHLGPPGGKLRLQGGSASPRGSRAPPVSARAVVNKVLARRKRKRRVSMAAAATAVAGPVFWRRLLGLLPGRPGLAALLGRLRSGRPGAEGGEPGLRPPSSYGGAKGLCVRTRGGGMSSCVALGP
ncbi:hypothetical protein EI555_014998, partial [Monodon monoceros]